MKIKLILTTLLLSLACFSLSACNETGPMEKAGKSVDDAVEDAGDSIDEAGNNIENSMDE